MIELLIVLGIIGILSAVVLVAINPGKQLCEANEAQRKTHERQMELAMQQYVTAEWDMPAGIPKGAENAKPVCRKGVMSDTGCVNLDVLTPDYLHELPVDPSQTGSGHTGYRAYADDFSRLHVESQFDGECERAAGSSSSSSSAIPPDLSLIGHWKFDEGVGSLATDSSGNANIATLMNYGCSTLDCNATSGWTSAGKQARAVNFDGTNDRMNAGSGASLGDLQDFSLALWIYPRSLGQGSNGRLLSKEGGGGFKRLELADNIGNNFQAWVETSGSTARVSSPLNSVSFNQWQHVTVTYVAATSSLSIHKNGVKVASGSGSGAPIADASGGLVIGNSRDTSHAFDGRMDEVRIYNRVLSLSEIAVLASNTQ